MKICQSNSSLDPKVRGKGGEGGAVGILPGHMDSPCYSRVCPEENCSLGEPRQGQMPDQSCSPWRGTSWLIVRINDLMGDHMEAVCSWRTVAHEKNSCWSSSWRTVVPRKDPHRNSSLRAFFLGRGLGLEQRKRMRRKKRQRWRDMNWYQDKFPIPLGHLSRERRVEELEVKLRLWEGVGVRCFYFCSYFSPSPSATVNLW